jgi:hypothetical protein
MMLADRITLPHFSVSAAMSTLRPFLQSDRCFEGPAEARSQFFTDR